MPTEPDEPLPNLVTIVGRGVPSNYELTVDGELEFVGAGPLEDATVVTDHAAEGAVTTGVTRFRFSGQLATVHVADWNGVPAPASPHTPTVHIEYGVPAQDDSH